MAEAAGSEINTLVSLTPSWLTCVAHRVAPLPVPLKRPGEAAQTLPREQRALLDALQGALRADALQYHEAYTIDLPPSVLGVLKRHKINPHQLFRQYSDDAAEQDARMMSFDSKGNRKRLTSGQLASIWRSGGFSVPSAAFPGETHYWELSWALFMGRKRTNDMVVRANDVLLDVLVWHMWRTLFATGQHDLSLLRQLYHVLREPVRLANLLLGLPWYQRQPPWHQAERLARARGVFIHSQLTSNEAVRAPPLNQPDLDMAPFRVWDKPQRVDTRKLAPDQHSIVQDAVHMAAEKFFAEWKETCRARINSLLHQVPGSSNDADSMPDDELTRIAHQVADECVSEWVDWLAKHASDLPPDVQPYMPQIVADAVGMMHVRQLMQQWQKEQKDERAAVVTHVQSKNPIRSRVAPWHRARVDAVMAQSKKTHSNVVLTRLLHRLESEGERAASARWFTQQHAEWISKHGASEAEAARRERKPPRTLSATRQIWRPSKWHVAKDPVTERYHIVSRATTSYVSTALPLWRVWRLLQLTWWAFMQGNFLLLLVLMLSSPVSLRVCFGVKSFCPNRRIDPVSGGIFPDPSYRVKPVAARFVSLWAGIIESVDAFNRTPDTGLLGKGVARIFVYLWNYLLKGLLGSCILLVVYPMFLLALNTLFLALVLASPIWAPAYAVLAYLFSVLIYDFDHGVPGTRWLPLVVWAVRLALHLLGAVLCAVAFVLLPVLAVLGVVLACVLWVLRTVWDTLVYLLVLCTLARVPSTDSFAARRTRGPGLSHQFFYQVDAEHALLYLLAKLERIELHQLQMLHQYRLDAPRRGLKQLQHNVMQPCNASVSLPQQVNATLSNLSVGVSDLVNERDRALSKLAPRQSSRVHIRMTREHLGTVLQHGKAIIKAFVTHRLDPIAQELRSLGDSDGAASLSMFASRDIADNDWDELTRRLLIEVFQHASILTPLEDHSATFQIGINHVGLSSFFSKIVDDGQGSLDDLDRVKTKALPRRARGSQFFTAYQQVMTRISIVAGITAPTLAQIAQPALLSRIDPELLYPTQLHDAHVFMPSTSFTVDKASASATPLSSP